MFWGARERIGALQPLENHRKYLSFCMPALYGGFRANSMKFIETKKFTDNVAISWKSWNFMEFIDFLDSATLHETFVFLAQNQGLSGLDPRKPKKPQKPPFPWIHLNFSMFRRIPGKSAKWCKNNLLEDSGGSLAATCWKPCYSYRNIEVSRGPDILKTSIFL